MKLPQTACSLTRIGKLLLSGAALFAASALVAEVSMKSTAEPVARYPIEPQFSLLRFGEIRPAGWIREQMIRDLESGFAGHMPEISPKTCASQIFGANRNDLRRRQNAGGGGHDGAAGMWYNGETEGNWRSGNIMMSLLTGKPGDRTNADQKVAEILKTQDVDGYMGIYAPALRWPVGKGNNGELWTQTCLFRGLIAYYEATGKPEVLRAVERAVQLTMSHYYGEGPREPFGARTLGHNFRPPDIGGGIFRGFQRAKAF